MPGRLCGFRRWPVLAGKHSCSAAAIASILGANDPLLHIFDLGSARKEVPPLLNHLVGCLVVRVKPYSAQSWKIRRLRQLFWRHVCAAKDGLLVCLSLWFR